MRAPASLLRHRTAADETSTSPAAPRSTPEQQQQTTAPVAMAVDSNMVVILASLLCALVCVLGLALVSRCACTRRRSVSSSSEPPPRGLKKKAINALPTVSFAPRIVSIASDGIMVLDVGVRDMLDGVRRGCGHAFHGACVDAWLRTCASCPSCRGPIVAMEPATTQAPALMVVVVVAAGRCSRCGTCGELTAPGGAGATGAGDCTFLP